MKTALLFIILFFSFQLVQAQDTLKHAGKHKHKTHISDSAKITHSSSKTHVKDTALIHRKRIVVPPKFPRTGYVAIMGGFGFPLGAFSSDGAAASGSCYSISAAFPGVISRWGIAVKIDDGINGFNQSRLINNLNINTGFPNITCSLPDSKLGHYSYSAFLAGLCLTYPHAHFTMDFRFLAGVMFAQIPSYTVNYYDQSTGNSSDYYQAATSASAFAFGFGFDARYPIKPRICIILSGDYVHAVPSFPMIASGATLASDGSITQGSGNEVTTGQPFNVFSLSLGVGYTISASPHKRHTHKVIAP